MVAVKPEDGLSAVTERAAAVDSVMVASDTEPADDDGREHDERIELVRTGLVRVWIGGRRYRLRRPFFGEFRSLRTSLQETVDDVQLASDEATTVARRMTLDAKDHPVDDTNPDEWLAWRTKLREASRAASDALQDRVDDVRLAWWEAMWATLSLDDRASGEPPEWPSWVTDPRLHAALVMHWRSSPLGRG